MVRFSLHRRARCDGPLDIRTCHVRDLAFSESRQDRERRLFPVVRLRPLTHAAIGNPARDVFLEEPLHPVSDGRRFPRVAAALKRVPFAIPDSDQLGPLPARGQL